MGCAASFPPGGEGDGVDGELSDREGPAQRGAGGGLSIIKPCLPVLPGKGARAAVDGQGRRRMVHDEIPPFGGGAEGDDVIRAAAVIDKAAQAEFVDGRLRLNAGRDFGPSIPRADDACLVARHGGRGGANGLGAVLASFAVKQADVFGDFAVGQGAAGAGLKS